MEVHLPTWLAILLGLFWLGVLVTLGFTVWRLLGNLKALTASVAELNRRLIPTLEESVAQRIWIIGTAAEVAEGIAAYRDELGLEHLTIFPQMPGETYEQCEDQMARWNETVRPLL